MVRVSVLTEVEGIKTKTERTNNQKVAKELIQHSKSVKIENCNLNKLIGIH